MPIQTRQRHEWEMTGAHGRVLVAAGRIAGGRTVSLGSANPNVPMNAEACRALAAWLLVQAADMEAEAGK